MKTKRILTIRLDADPEQDDTIVDHVLCLIKQGYICGSYPHWEIKTREIEDVRTCKV